MVAQLQAEQAWKVNYLSREDALGEFRNWSGFGGALDMLEKTASGSGGGDRNSIFRGRSH